MPLRFTLLSALARAWEPPRQNQGGSNQLSTGRRQTKKPQRLV